MPFADELMTAAPRSHRPHPCPGETVGVDREHLFRSITARRYGQVGQDHVAPSGRASRIDCDAHKGGQIRRWATKPKGELCFTPTNAS